MYVAVNEYDPKGQWRRMRKNDRVSPFWRYSVGTLAWMHYTLLPNRLFGGDRYDPFANSLNLSSDVQSLVLSEAAYAKDIHSRRHPGAYAAIVNDMPVLSIWRRARAASDVLGYARAKRRLEDGGTGLSCAVSSDRRGFRRHGGAVCARRRPVHLVGRRRRGTRDRPHGRSRATLEAAQVSRQGEPPNGADAIAAKPPPPLLNSPPTPVAVARQRPSEAVQVSHEQLRPARPEP